MSTSPVQSATFVSSAETAVLRRGSSAAGPAGADDLEPRPPRRVLLPGARRMPAEASAAGPAVVVAVEAVPVVHGDLDLRASFGSLPRVHALAMPRLPIGPYAPAAEALRGALVDRYV